MDGRRDVGTASDDAFFTSTCPNPAHGCESVVVWEDDKVCKGQVRNENKEVGVRMCSSVY